jgi:glutamate N-acetyltransferase/amino-acid N-acetyltransferase
MLGRNVQKTLNCLTVDGDTSTNDCAILLASGKAGNAEITGDDSTGAAEFEKALTTVLDGLAKMLAADGEGATKLVRIEVGDAVDDTQARTAALAVANSPLVKTAMFGEDANWGRFMMALGKSGADFDPGKVSISLDEIPLVKDGRYVGDEGSSTAVMKKQEYTVYINLNAGNGRAHVWTCDFSYDYVKINADYRS